MATFIATKTGQPIASCCRISFIEMEQQVNDLIRLEKVGEEEMPEQVKQTKATTLEEIQREVVEQGCSDPKELLKRMTRLGIGSPPPKE